MNRRRDRRGGVDELLAIASKLPWWVSLLIALVSFLILNAIASQEIDTTPVDGNIGAVAAKGLYSTLASIGQYIVPLIFVFGAVVSGIAQRKRMALVDRVAGSESHAALGEMTWREFEGLVQETFRREGYTVQRVGGDGPDGGVDLVLNRGPEKVLVQCKQWRAQRVGVSVVRELYGVMAAQGAAAGIVVTSGTFTPDAVDFARGRNLRLIDGTELRGMIQEVAPATGRDGPGPESRNPIIADQAPGCPRCGSPMVKRTAKRGANAGLAFYGCSRYPDCRGTVPLD